MDAVKRTNKWGGGRCSIVKPLVRVLGIIILLAGAVLTGCDPVARESIKVRLPTTSESETAKHTLALIEQVMKEHEFRSLRIGSQINDSTLVAAYGDSVESHLGAFVYHRKGEIEIELNQLGRYKLSPAGIRTKDDLRKKLIEMYGKGKISS